MKVYPSQEAKWRKHAIGYKATDKQKAYLLHLCNIFECLPEINLDQMTMIEASDLIQKLKNEGVAKNV